MDKARSSGSSVIRPFERRNSSRIPVSERTGSSNLTKLQTEIQFLSNERNILSDENQSLKIEIRLLRLDIDSLKMNLYEANLEISKLKQPGEMSSISTSQMLELTKQNGKLSKDLTEIQDKYQAHINESDEEMCHLKSQLEATMTQTQETKDKALVKNKELLDKIVDLNQTIATLKGDLVSKQAEMDGLHGTYNERMQVTDAEKRELLHTLSQCAKFIEESKKQLKSLQKNNMRALDLEMEMEAEKTSLTDQLQTLKADNTRVTLQNEELQAKHSQLDTDIAKLKQDLAEQAMIIKDLEEQARVKNEAHNHDVTELREKNANLTKMNADFKANIGHLEFLNQEMEAKKTSLTYQLEALMVDKTMVTSQNEELQAENSQQKTEIRPLKTLKSIELCTASSCLEPDFAPNSSSRDEDHEMYINYDQCERCEVSDGNYTSIRDQNRPHAALNIDDGNDEYLDCLEPSESKRSSAEDDDDEYLDCLEPSESECSSGDDSDDECLDCLELSKSINNLTSEETESYYYDCQHSDTETHNALCSGDNESNVSLSQITLCTLSGDENLMAIASSKDNKNNKPVCHSSYGGRVSSSVCKFLVLVKTLAKGLCYFGVWSLCFSVGIIIAAYAFEVSSNSATHCLLDEMFGCLENRIVLF